MSCRCVSKLFILLGSVLIVGSVAAWVNTGSYMLSKLAFHPVPVEQTDSTANSTASIDDLFGEVAPETQQNLPELPSNDYRFGLLPNGDMNAGMLSVLSVGGPGLALVLLGAFFYFKKSKSVCSDKKTCAVP